jgi:transcriptional regulator NrdR family protein
MYRVQKKDGSLEDFNSDKVIIGVRKAGGTEEDAKKVLSEVETWLVSKAINKVVTSADIRTKCLEALRLANPEVASEYESYKKPIPNTN